VLRKEVSMLTKQLADAKAELAEERQKLQKAHEDALAKSEQSRRDIIDDLKIKLDEANRNWRASAESQVSECVALREELELRRADATKLQTDLASLRAENWNLQSKLKADGAF
jgi:hypothetical protein